MSLRNRNQHATPPYPTGFVHDLGGVVQILSSCVVVLRLEPPYKFRGFVRCVNNHGLCLQVRGQWRVTLQVSFFG